MNVKKRGGDKAKVQKKAFKEEKEGGLRRSIWLFFVNFAFVGSVYGDFPVR